MFWLIWIPLYEEFQPLFVTNGTRLEDFNQTSADSLSNETRDQFEQNMTRTMNDNKTKTNTKDSALDKNRENNSETSYNGSNLLNTTNFSAYQNGENETSSTNSFVDLPDFNVNIIYYTIYSPNGIAVQLLQNFFVWLTSSLFWLYFTPFYTRSQFYHTIYLQLNQKAEPFLQMSRFIYI